MGLENWTHAQTRYVSHYNLVNFRHTWLLYINRILRDKKLIVKISGGFQISAGNSPRNYAWNNHYKLAYI